MEIVIVKLSIVAGLTYHLAADRPLLTPTDGDTNVALFLTPALAPPVVSFPPHPPPTTTTATATTPPPPSRARTHYIFRRTGPSSRRRGWCVRTLGSWPKRRRRRAPTPDNPLAAAAPPTTTRRHEAQGRQGKVSLLAALAACLWLRAFSADPPLAQQLPAVIPWLCFPRNPTQPRPTPSTPIVQVQTAHAEGQVQDRAQGTRTPP